MGKKQLFWLMFGVLVVYGMFIRMYGLGADSYWLDESISVLAAQNIHHYGIPLFDSGAPYFRAVIFHYAVSMILLVSPAEFAARSISVVFGVLTACLMFLLGKAYNRQTAWLSLVAGLFLEIFVVYSRQARMYQMEMLFFFLTVYLLHAALKKGSRPLAKSSGSNKLLFIAFISFLVAVDTHPAGLVLIPLFLFVVHRKQSAQVRTAVYALAAVAAVYTVRIAWHLIGSGNSAQLFAYTAYLWYYAPFAVIAVAGVYVARKKIMTWFLVYSFLAVFFAASMGTQFAFRYVYVAFVPVVVLAMAAASSFKRGWMVMAVYLLVASNLFAPFGASMILVPESTISHYDPTMPTADFKGMYSSIDHSKPLVTTITPAAAVYGKKPSYWINMSYTGDPEGNWTIVNNREIYSNASVVYTVDELSRIQDKIIVVDDWSMKRISSSLRMFITENCTLVSQKRGISAYEC